MNIDSQLFLQFTLSLTVLLFLWILKLKTRKAKNHESKQLGVIELLDMAYMLFIAKSQVISGLEVSRYIKVYKKYFSANSLYPKQSVFINRFGFSVFVANDYETIQQINKNDACHDRGPEGPVQSYTKGRPTGIIMNNGEEGRILKQFVVKKFGQLGLRNKENISLVLMDQLSELLAHIEVLKAQTNNKIAAVGLFSSAVINIIATSSFGRKFSCDDPELISLNKITTEITNVSIFNVIFVYCLQNVWGIRDLFGYTHHCDLYDNLRKIIQSYIEESESKAKSSHDPDNLIDYFIQEMEKQKDNSSKLNTVFCKDQLITLLQDLILAGMDTTSKFLDSFLMYMCLNPDVQSKVQEEIDDVLGTSAFPRYYESKSRMNFTMATLWEVHRLTLMIPVIPRMVTKDAEIAGHRLKRGTIIINNYLRPRLDETYWKKPFIFSPENFLDENGKFVQEKAERMLIFSSGSRHCPGEQISTAVSFTLCVGILQKYTINKGDDFENMGPRKGTCLVNGVKDFHISLFDR